MGHAALANEYTVLFRTLKRTRYSQTRHINQDRGLRALCNSSTHTFLHAMLMSVVVATVHMHSY
jgi:hypothetical protein